MMDNSAEFCIKEIKRTTQMVIELNPGVKVVLSAPTPRSDSVEVNNKGQLISALLLKNEYINNQEIFICDNSNLSFKGKPLERFIAKDHYVCGKYS